MQNEPDSGTPLDLHGQAVTAPPRLRDLLREDLRVHSGGLTAPGFHAVAVHRLGTWGRTQAPAGLRPVIALLHKVVYTFVRNFYGIELPVTVQLGRRVKLAHQSGIVVHPRSSIGDDSVLRQGVTLGAGAGGEGSLAQAPTVGKGVSLGVNAVVVGAVRIGDEAMIGPNVTVFTNVPPGAKVLPAPPRTMRAPAADAGRRDAEQSA